MQRPCTVNKKHSKNFLQSHKNRSLLIFLYFCYNTGNSKIFYSQSKNLFYISCSDLTQSRKNSKVIQKQFSLSFIAFLPKNRNLKNFCTSWTNLGHCPTWDSQLKEFAKLFIVTEKQKFRKKFFFLTTKQKSLKIFYSVSKDKFWDSQKNSKNIL